MKRKKPRTIRLRFRKNDPTHNLLAAAQHWVLANGGTTVLVAGPEIQDWLDGAGKYRVAVRFLGKPPTQPEKK